MAPPLRLRDLHREHLPPGAAVLAVGPTIALVDAADFALVAPRLWHQAGGYGRSTTRDGGRVRTVYLARDVLGRSDDRDRRWVIDHVNGDRLDCRRSNLRWCTKGEQLANVPIDHLNSTGYKGAVASGGQGWIAVLKVAGLRRTRGPFPSIEVAARAYDELARAAYGPGARLNFPGPGERSALRYEREAWPRLRVLGEAP